MKHTSSKTRIGPWKMGRTLGQGNFGKVRLAKHIITGEFSAIKEVRRQYGPCTGSVNDYYVEDGEISTAVVREIAIMKILHHLNIMKYIEMWERSPSDEIKQHKTSFGTYDSDDDPCNKLYLVLEYCPGGTLFDFVCKHGALDEIDAMAIFRQIISALAHMHSFNICHRDLKLENILLNRTGNVKIVDFGLSALQPQGMMLNSPCGSPHYSAPEVILGNYDGLKADIWSCGVVLYALLNGNLPFDDSQLEILAAKVCLGEFELDSSLSVEVKDLLYRLIEVEPQYRITIDQIWQHSLFQRHRSTGYQAQERQSGSSHHTLGKKVTEDRLEAGDIDPEVFKSLHSLWHRYDDEVLFYKLTSFEMTHERACYFMLLKYANRYIDDVVATEGKKHKLLPNLRGRPPTRSPLTHRLANNQRPGRKRAIEALETSPPAQRFFQQEGLYDKENMRPTLKLELHKHQHRRQIGQKPRIAPTVGRTNGNPQTPKKKLEISKPPLQYKRSNIDVRSIENTQKSRINSSSARIVEDADMCDVPWPRKESNIVSSLKASQRRKSRSSVVTNHKRRVSFPRIKLLVERDVRTTLVSRSAGGDANSFQSKPEQPLKDFEKEVEAIFNLKSVSMLPVPTAMKPLERDTLVIGNLQPYDIGGESSSPKAKVYENDTNPAVFDPVFPVIEQKGGAKTFATGRRFRGMGNRVTDGPMEQKIQSDIAEETRRLFDAPMPEVVRERSPSFLVGSCSMPEDRRPEARSEISAQPNHLPVKPVPKQGSLRTRACSIVRDFIKSLRIAVPNFCRSGPKINEYGQHFGKHDQRMGDTHNPNGQRTQGEIYLNVRPDFVTHQLSGSLQEEQMNDETSTSFSKPKKS